MQRRVGRLGALSGNVANTPEEVSILEEPAITGVITDGGEMPMEMTPMAMLSSGNIDEIMVDTESGEIGDDVAEDASEEAERALVETAPHTANLAGIMSRERLDALGAKVLDQVASDERSRGPWFKRFEDGVKALGIYATSDTEAVMGGEIKHPLLLEAAVQFQARAMAELYPPNGPAKPATLGTPTIEKQQQGLRVAEHINYSLTIDDPVYYEEREGMLFSLAITGCEFSKQYFDPVRNKVVSRWIRSKDFIMDYNASSILDCEQGAQRVQMHANEWRRNVAAGVYVDLLREGDKQDPTLDINSERDKVEKVIDKIDGVEYEDSEHNRVYNLYEVYANLYLFDDETFPRPYIITIEQSTKQVVGLYRNWQEAGTIFDKMVNVVQHNFLPGIGSYGMGLFHAIGALGEAASQLLNLIMDNGAFASLQGGFKSKDAKLPSDVQLEPGKWIDTEMTAEELSRSFYTPPFREVSPTLQSVLGMLVEGGQRFAATTDTMVGDAANTGPVGTTVALIEQGGKVYSGIHMRLHRAIGRELRAIHDLIAAHEEQYPYETDGDLQQDFDGRIDVVPVSDPHIFSTAQRLAQAQAIWQLAQGAPDLVDRQTAMQRMLTALRVPDADQLVPKQGEVLPTDPVTEGSYAVTGKPIKAFYPQDHQAHIMVHQMQMMQMPPEAQAPMKAHIMEHIAILMSQQMEQQIGIRLPNVLGAMPGEQPQQPMPPEMEQEISRRAAMVSQQMMQQMMAAQQAQQGGPQQQPDPAAEAAKEQQQKDIAFAANEQRKDAAAAAAIDRKDAMVGLSPTLVKQAGQFLQERGMGSLMSPRQLAVMAREFNMDFDKTLRQLSRFAMGGQGAPVSPGAEQIQGQRTGFQ